MSDHIAKQIHDLPTSARDLCHLFLGERIGSGMSRTVYAHGADPSLVVKHESGGGSFQNVLEWTVWEAVKDSPMARWFAPCVSISPNGLFLVQKRATFPPRDEYPEKVPAFFTDLKYGNFGRIDGQFVCVDYGTFNLVRNSFTAAFRKARWWSEKD